MPKYVGERLALCLLFFIATYGFFAFSTNPADPFRVDFTGFQIICIIITIVCILMLAAMED